MVRLQRAPSAREPGDRRARVQGHAGGALTRAGAGERRGVALAALLVVVAGAAVYANSLGGELLFDDKGSIRTNESIRDLTRLGDVLTGAKYATVIGRPVLNLSLAMNYAAGGTSVTGYHIVNALIHIAAGLVLFDVVRRTLASARFAESLARHATGLALATALLWTVHPLQTESVTYVCQRAESLAGLLMLATLWCAMRGADSKQSPRWTIAAVAACFFSVGTKETAAATPLLVLLHDRTFVAGTFRDALRRRPRLYAGLAASWLLLGVLVLSSKGRSGSAGFESGVSVADYAATQPAAIVEYLRLSFWPHPLVLDRGALLARTAMEIAPYALVVAALLAATLWALRARPALGFLGAWFFLILAPTSSVVPLATQTVAEHRMYLPLAAVVCATVLAAHSLLRGRVAQQWLACGAAALALGFITHERNALYRTEFEMWRHNAKYAPGNYRSHLNYGACQQDAGDLEGALASFRRGVALAPSDPVAHVYLGNVLHALGRDDEAIAAFTAMLTAVPGYSCVAYSNRGMILADQGKTEAAMADLDAALREFPEFPDALRNRAVLRLNAGDIRGARQDLEHFIRVGGDPPPELRRRVGL